MPHVLQKLEHMHCASHLKTHALCQTVVSTIGFYVIQIVNMYLMSLRDKHMRYTTTMVEASINAIQCEYMLHVDKYY